MRNHTRRRVSGIWVAGCALTASALLGGALPALAQDPASSTITLDLRDASLEPAVQALKQQAGIQNVVVIPGRYSRVNVSLTDQPAEKALRVIAEAAGAVVQFEDGIYYLRPKGTETPKPAPKEEPVVVVAPKKAPRQTVKIPLMYLPPRDFVRMLSDPNYVPFMREVFGMGTSPNVQTVGGINNAAIASPVPVPVATPNGTVAGQAGQAGQTSDDGTGSAGQRGGFGGGGIGGGGLGGGIGGGRGGNLGGLGGGGFGGGQGGGIGGGQGGNIGGGTIRPEGIDNIISSDADNSLLVQGTPQAIEELRSIVRLLDIAPKQVLVKAEFVSVGIQDAEAFGIDWKFTPAQNLDVNFASPALNAPPSVTMAYASGNAVAAMRVALTRSTSNLLQAPIISTSNNQIGFIQVTTTNTFFINQQTLTQFGSFTQTQVFNIPTVSGLQILPHINGDNTISMQLSPVLQSQSVLPGPNGQPQINIQTQQLVTSRRLKNGETMVLGGFITRQEDKGEFKIPLLADLPVIGQLFTQRSKAVNAREILVFITPTIIEDIPNGTGGAGPAL